MIKAKWWNKRKPGYAGGSKPLLKKRRIFNEENGSEITKKKLIVVNDSNPDDSVVEVRDAIGLEDEEEIFNPVNELLSIFQVAGRKSAVKSITKSSCIEPKDDENTGEPESASEKAKKDGRFQYNSDESDEDSEYFEATEIPINVENTFDRHFEADKTHWALKYSSLMVKSIDINLPNLGSGLYEYRCTDEEKETTKEIKMKKSLMEFDLKQSLLDNLPKALANIMDDDDSLPKLNGLQFEILSILHDYKDILFCERNSTNGEQIRLLYTLHGLNHILKTRNKVLHHNAKLAKANKKKDSDYRDHGLTRPKVLIVVPFRESAYRTIECLINLVSSDEDKERLSIMNHKRFKEEFESTESQIQPGKPADYNDLFTGNIDDSFRIGIAVTRKSLKLYADFYSCDIIIASPLGLRLIIGAEGEKERDYDFLSSIEFLVLDQADVFLMQNWEHIIDLMKHLHLQPNDSHGTDFSRVRMWALEGHYKFYRQTAIFSSTSCPQINSLFKNRCFNYEGRLTFRQPITSSKDQLHLVFVSCPQSFYRFESQSIVSSPDQRFDYFTKVILPKCREIGETHTLIYIPSYFDFVKLRNYFRMEDINFTQICEYTKKGKIAQSRAWFFHEGRNFLLYTERSHFYNRFRIKGIRHLVFYQLPTYPHFYSELVNLLHPSYQGKKFVGDETMMNCTILFDKFDLIQLEKIVGTEKAAYLIKSETDNHVFISQARKTITS
ncbi:U3 small nucleolar RNA-associated protein 25 homolog [Panonychus citri]|uniref:U3 small nucleolar RNA-associated protein 25 homolog n=1 Tax=Panonychus citri TaxID=50023 RepID=UPI0023078CF9|nr:U3 small nucleolar RNA-associated protein 25 homolog [Panonychus citri]